jgi:hypothetical protein
MDVKSFINKYGNQITLSSKRVDFNPHYCNDHNSDHWKVTIKMFGRQYTTYFSQGYAFHGKEPELKYILDAFQSDINSIQEGLTEFICAYGYEDDVSKGKRIYYNIEKTEERLKQLMGEAYDDLVSY